MAGNLKNPISLTIVYTFTSTKGVAVFLKHRCVLESPRRLVWTETGEAWFSLSRSRVEPVNQHFRAVPRRGSCLLKKHHVSGLTCWGSKWAPSPSCFLPPAFCVTFIQSQSLISFLKEKKCYQAKVRWRLQCVRLCAYPVKYLLSSMYSKHGF